MKNRAQVDTRSHARERQPGEGEREGGREGGRVKKVSSFFAVFALPVLPGRGTVGQDPGGRAGAGVVCLYCFRIGMGRGGILGGIVIVVGIAFLARVRVQQRNEDIVT